VSEKHLPRYPIYIPSKGRSDQCATGSFLLSDGVPFRLVVEPQERDAYAEKFGEDRVLVLPWNNPGSVIPARNWIKEHATAEGHKRHWQLDDNISYIMRYWNGQRIRCAAGAALAATEDFVDRYENIAIAGLEYVMFAIKVTKPFTLNTRIYSCSLVLNSLPHRWRGRYNEDTDICLQVLADGYCTVLVNAFLVQKIGTMVVKGGNTATIYGGDGRLKMARSLERLWPGVVSVDRRFKRPQHVVRDSWRRFDTPLKRRDDIDFEAIGPSEYGLELKQVGSEVRSHRLRQLLEKANEKRSPNV
jgi:hypothetical protein